MFHGLKKLFFATPGKPPAPQPPQITGFNEAVSVSKQAIFVAVPKTGTTAIREQLRDDATFLVTEPHLNIREIRHGLDFYFLQQNLHQNRNFPTDPQTVLSTGEALDRAQAFYDGCFKFGSVRNPFARVVSLYRRREGLQLQDELSFSAFCDRLAYGSDTCTRPSRHSDQIEWFLDDSGSVAVDFILKLEDRETALDEINALTDGRLGLKNLKRNVNTAADERSYRDFYDDAARQKIATLFERDLDMLGYTF